MFVGLLQTAAENVKADLMNRLNNAVKQRDQAREDLLLATQKLTQLQEDMDSGALNNANRASSLADPGQYQIDAAHFEYQTMAGGSIYGR